MTPGVPSDPGSGGRRHGLVNPAVLRGVGTLLLAGDLVLLLAALYLGFHLEPTYEASLRAEKGQLVGAPAFVSLVACVVAMVGSRRRWAWPVLGVAVALGVVGLLVLVLRDAPAMGLGGTPALPPFTA